MMELLRPWVRSSKTNLCIFPSAVKERANFTPEQIRGIEKTLLKFDLTTVKLGIWYYARAINHLQTQDGVEKERKKLQTMHSNIIRQNDDLNSSEGIAGIIVNYTAEKERYENEISTLEMILSDLISGKRQPASVRIGYASLIEQFHITTDQIVIIEEELQAIEKSRYYKKIKRLDDILAFLKTQQSIDGVRGKIAEMTALAKIDCHLKDLESPDGIERLRKKYAAEKERQERILTVILEKFRATPEQE